MQPKRIGKHISITYRYAMVYFKERMAELGLSQSHHSVLLTLYRCEGVSQEQLSRKLNVDKATITRSIKKLTHDGFIRREQDEHDKRVYRLFLTEKSNTIKPDIEAMFREWNDIITEGLTTEEFDEAFRLMEKISSNVLKYHNKTKSELECPEHEVNNNE